MKYIKVVIAIVLFLIVALIAFFFLSKKQVVPQKYSGPVDKINLANIGEYSIFNIIAKNKGYFAENGLDATVTEYSAGPASINTLLTGKADIAIAADFVGVINIFNNPDIRIISEASQQKVFNLISLKNQGILIPADLKNKTIGVTQKSAGEFYLDRFLILNNITPDQVTEVNLTPAQMLTELQSGQIDAAAIFDPYAYNLRMQYGDKVNSWSLQGDQNTFALVYSTNDYIENHKNVIKRYLQALNEAEDLAINNPADAQAIIASSLKYKPEYVKYMWNNFDFAIGLDQQLLLTMEDQANFAIQNNLIKDKKDKVVPNYLNYIYFDGLNAVKSESINIIH